VLRLIMLLLLLLLCRLQVSAGRSGGFGNGSRGSIYCCCLYLRPLAITTSIGSSSSSVIPHAGVT
jgi:hypothetical protein